MENQFVSFQLLAEKCIEEKKYLWYFIGLCNQVKKHPDESLWKNPQFLSALRYLIENSNRFNVHDIEYTNTEGKIKIRKSVDLDPRDYWGFHAGQHLRGMERNEICAYMQLILERILDQTGKIHWTSKSVKLQIDMIERCESVRPYEFVRCMMDALSKKTIPCAVSEFYTERISTCVVIVAN